MADLMTAPTMEASNRGLNPQHDALPADDHSHDAQNDDDIDIVLAASPGPSRSSPHNNHNSSTIINGSTGLLDGRSKRLREEAVQRLMGDIQRTATLFHANHNPNHNHNHANHNANANSLLHHGHNSLNHSPLEHEEQQQLVIASTIATALERNLDRDLHSSLTAQVQSSASAISSICHSHSDSFLSSVGKVVSLGSDVTAIKHVVEVAHSELETKTVRPMLEAAHQLKYAKHLVAKARIVAGVVGGCEKVAKVLERAKKQAAAGRSRGALDCVDEARACLSAPLGSLVGVGVGVGSGSGSNGGSNGGGGGNDDAKDPTSATFAALDIMNMDADMGMGIGIGMHNHHNHNDGGGGGSEEMKRILSELLREENVHHDMNQSTTTTTTHAPSASASASATSIHATDADDLAGRPASSVALRQLLPRLVSDELQLYFTRITHALATHPSSAITRLATDTGIQELIPFFTRYITLTIHQNMDHVHQCRLMIHCIDALIRNRNVHLELHLDQILPSVLTCIVARRLGADGENHWLLRDEASDVIVRVCALFGDKYGNLRGKVIQTLCKALQLQHIDGIGAVDVAPTTTATTTTAAATTTTTSSSSTRGDPSVGDNDLGRWYGGIVGITKFGPKTVDAFILPLVGHWGIWEKVLEDSSSKSTAHISQEVRFALQRCQDALLQAMAVFLGSVAEKEQSKRIDGEKLFHVFGDRLVPLQTNVISEYSTCFI